MILPRVDLDRVIGDLDAHYLPETPRLAQRRGEIARAYRAAPHRPPAHAGLAYPNEPRASAATLEGFLRGPAMGAGSADAVRNAHPRGILAPHIDLHRGGPTYGCAFAALREIPPDACVVVLGVAHAGSPNPFVLTAKGYATPSPA
ncbi:MAG TPA: AmmeMemoRadiSam system protein B [bacterium]|nr:AmmeMemoRadiSam system protein B [bacterium]